METHLEGMETRLPLATAVLICRNHECYVRAAVLSAVHQSYSNIELIVIDNGSTDNSRSELQILQSEYGFRLICQENVGLTAALNQALALAKGKYFAMLATDDIWFPNKTAVQVSFLESNPDVHLVSAQVQPIDIEGNLSARYLPERPGDATFRDLMSLGCFVYGPTVMCRVQSLRELGGYDETLRIEDYSLALRMAYEYRRIVVLGEDLTFYRRHPQNWTAKSILPELAEIGAKYRHTPEYVAFYRHQFPLSFWRLVKDGQKRQALQLLVSEPVPWTWKNVGRGLVRMLIPYGLIRIYRRLTGKPPEGETVS